MSGKAKTLICDSCRAQCCRYVATQIDPPVRKRDYDHIRWYLLHKNVFVFIDHDEEWYLEFETSCSALQKSNLCGNYDDRPKICIKHGEGRSMCEFISEQEPHVVRFSTAVDFEAYLDKRGMNWRFKKNGKKRK
jgi:Fe-S-cluster containining protein